MNERSLNGAVCVKEEKVKVGAARILTLERFGILINNDAASDYHQRRKPKMLPSERREKMHKSAMIASQ